MQVTGFIQADKAKGVKRLLFFAPYIDILWMDNYRKARVYMHHSHL